MDHLRREEDDEDERLRQLIITSQTHEARLEAYRERMNQSSIPLCVSTLDTINSNDPQIPGIAQTDSPHKCSTEVLSKSSSKHPERASSLQTPPTNAQNDLKCDSANSSYTTSGSGSETRTSAISAETLISLEDPDSHVQNGGHSSGTAQSCPVSPHWDELRELQLGSLRKFENSGSIKATEAQHEKGIMALDQYIKVDHKPDVTKTIKRKPVTIGAKSGTISQIDGKDRCMPTVNVSSAPQTQAFDRQPQRSPSVQAPIAIDNMEDNGLTNSMFSELSDLARVMGPRRSRGTS